MELLDLQDIINDSTELLENPTLKYPPGSVLLYYKSKTENMLNTFCTYYKARSNIEIVPIDYEKFDAFSFIDFALALNENGFYYFYVKEPVKTISHSRDAKVEVYRKSKFENTPPEDEFAFKIKITENFRDIQVYVKNLMSRFEYTDIEGNKHITFVKSKWDHFQICNYYGQIRKDSLFYNIAIYFANEKRHCPSSLRSIFINFQSDPIKNKKKRIGQTDDFIEMIMSFPGVVKINLQKKLNSGYSFKIDPKWKEYQNVFISSQINNDEEYSIHSFVVLFPWARSIIDNCYFLEMDACFKSLKPYCFSICNGIHMNESYPMGMSICPSEAEILYQIFVDASSEFKIKNEIWKSKTLLSDMHPSLCCFAKKNCKEHFFCHRHIYEYFGANSALYFFVARLLKCYSFEEYDDIRLDIIQQSKAYYNEKKTKYVDKMDENFIKKYKKLQKMLSVDQTKKDSKWHYSHWALWTRSEFGVSTCSNHSEGFHTGANKVNSNNENFCSRVSNLLKKVIGHANNISLNHGKSLHAKCKKMRENIISKLQNTYCDLSYFCNTECKCKKDEFLSSLYGTKVDCEHKIFQNCAKYIEKIDIDKKVMKEIILTILVKDEETPHQKIENKIIDLKKEIMEKYKIKPDDHSNIEDLIKSVLMCFQIKPNSGIQFEIDYNFQKLIIEKKEETIDFSKRNNNSNNSNNNNKIKEKSKIKKDDNDFWFQDITSDVIKKAHKLKYETLWEIEYFYPKLKEENLSIKIVDFNYRKFFFQRDENELIYTFPQFKISCWKDADNSMQSTKFFD